jgi:nuclear-control-of-ATPase protein 2
LTTGVLISSVGGMRVWADGLRGERKEVSPLGSGEMSLLLKSAPAQDFMDDLRLLENAKLGREGKLRVVDRMWRGWSIDGRGTLGR